MIAYLEGTLREKSPTHVVLAAGGVGYRVHIPVSTFYGLPDEGQSLALRIYTHVREDVLALYGFKAAMEESLFRQLIGVAGVGPALALKIMSGLEVSVLVNAIRQGDLKRLSAIPGVGRKTAERLVLELRDKMPSVAGAFEAESAAAGPSMADDLVSALTNLGFPAQLAEKEVARSLRDQTHDSFEAALKHVLRRLSG